MHPAENGTGDPQGSESSDEEERKVADAIREQLQPLVGRPNDSDAHENVRRIVVEQFRELIRQGRVLVPYEEPRVYAHPLDPHKLVVELSDRWREALEHLDEVPHVSPGPDDRPYCPSCGAGCPFCDGGARD